MVQQRINFVKTFAEEKGEDGGLMDQMKGNRIPSPYDEWNYKDEDDEQKKLKFIIAALDAPKMLIDHN